MKQHPTSSLASLAVAAGVCSLLFGCGGGGSQDAQEVPPAAPGPAFTAGSPSTAPSSTVAAGGNAQPTTEPPPAANAAATPPGTAAAADPSKQPALALGPGLAITREALLGFNTDFTRPHEAAPAGVPSGYDWYAKARAGSWNTLPSGFTALTGWGQAFWAKGTTTPSAHLLLKNHLTFVCQGVQRQWWLLQSSSVEGAVFQPDYSTNTGVKAASPGVVEGNALALTFSATMAYHFWPSAARGVLQGGPVCGTLTLVQARAQPLTANSYDTPNLLLGMGADYWLDKTAPWDNYKTNRDVAIGRLKLVTTTWAWYGLSTAANEDLERLFSNGFVVTR